MTSESTSMRCALFLLAVVLLAPFGILALYLRFLWLLVELAWAVGFRLLGAARRRRSRVRVSRCVPR